MGMGTVYFGKIAAVMKKMTECNAKCNNYIL